MVSGDAFFIKYPRYFFLDIYFLQKCPFLDSQKTFQLFKKYFSLHDFFEIFNFILHGCRENNDFL